MTRQEICRLVVENAEFGSGGLAEVFASLGFVQADPIRSPARAEELILRQRVRGYRVGDFDAAYASLEVEEDFLYAHGFMTGEVWRLLHPRQSLVLQGLQLEVFQYVQQVGAVNSDDLAEVFGRTRVRNWWGGQSQATRMALEELHYHGYVKIAGRRNGVRLYAYFEPQDMGMTNEQRIGELVLRVVKILGPITLTSLSQALGRTRRLFGPTTPIIRQLLADGRLCSLVVDRVEYLALPQLAELHQKSDDRRIVRFLAPFDPIVWDRRRFEHLWGWPYRFEAYTPAAKRVRGYYAMPLFYGSQAIGWVNVKKVGDDIHVEDGYISARPKTKAYQQQFQAEVNRLRHFLWFGTADPRADWDNS